MSPREAGVTSRSSPRRLMRSEELDAVGLNHEVHRHEEGKASTSDSKGNGGEMSDGVPPCTSPVSRAPIAPRFAPLPPADPPSPLATEPLVLTCCRRSLGRDSCYAVIARCRSSPSLPSYRRCAVARPVLPLVSERSRSEHSSLPHRRHWCRRPRSQTRHCCRRSGGRVGCPPLWHVARRGAGNAAVWLSSETASGRRTAPCCRGVR